MDNIRDIAEQILITKPDAAACVRLLRDVLHFSLESPELVQAQNDLNKSCWVSQLNSEQRQDGSLGRFHSADSKRRQNIPTTEFAIARAESLGLDDSHPILQRAIDYLVCVLEGEIDFPDPPEKNVRWPVGTKLFAAATLASVKPEHPALSEYLEIWSSIAEQTFASGKYDADAEDEAHSHWTGASVRNTYLTLHNKYQLILLSSRSNLLSLRTERSLLDWICHRQNGIGYLGIPLSPFKSDARASQIEHWFTSWEIISQFSSWRDYADKVIQWLWKRQNKNDFWVFGPRASHATFLPLSENWQKKLNRQFDWTTRTLLLMEKYYQ